MKDIDLKNFKKVVIAPCFEDLTALRTFIPKVSEVSLDDMCLLIIDDGSIKEPVAAADLGPLVIPVFVVSLIRNVGNQAALFAGICFAAKRCATDATVIIMDCDGEDRPEDIMRLLGALDASSKSVAVASRKRRQEGLQFKIFYEIYKFIFRLATGQKVTFGNFMAMPLSSLKRLASMTETSTHLPAAVIESKLEMEFVEIDRGLRYHGSSKMNMVGLALHD